MNRVPSRTLIVTAVCACLLHWNGCGKSAEQQASPTVTIENLQAAYAKELKYHQMFLQFARQAEKERFSGTARLYRALARSEEIHATGIAVLLRSLGATPAEPTIEPAVVGKTVQTLKMSLSSEAIEAGSFFPNLIKTAEGEHVPAAVRQLTAVRDADAGHADLLSKALRTNGVVSVRTFFICPVCGLVMTPETVKDCVGCGVPKVNFEVV